MLGVGSPRRTRSRRGQQNTMKASGTPVQIVSAAFTTPNIVVTFNGPVVKAGIPQYLTDTGKLPTAATLAADKLSVSLAYDTPGSVTEITIPVNDPAIHSFSGGGVTPGTFPAT